jgi:antitoxin component of RelBE/YafQ-DinJ toxin-antitoxin module
MLVIDVSAKTVNFQTQIDPKTRESAEQEAQRQGFNNLQDAVRLFIKQLAAKQLKFSFAPANEEILSPEQIKRYDEEVAEAEELIKEGKRKYYSTATELIAALDEEAR